MKYIVTLNETGLPCAIVFNEALTHKTVAGNMKVISVGFYNPETKSVFGHSQSLNLGCVKLPTK